MASFWIRGNPLAKDNPVDYGTEHTRFTGDDPKLESRAVKGADGETLYDRMAYEGNSRVGISHEEGVVLHGESMILEEEHRDKDSGALLQVYRRLKDDGRPGGTYLATWEVTGRGQLTHTRTRRIHE